MFVWFLKATAVWLYKAPASSSTDAARPELKEETVVRKVGGASSETEKSAQKKRAVLEIEEGRA